MIEQLRAYNKELEARHTAVEQLSDTELIDLLEKMREPNRHGIPIRNVVCRWSGIGRGWRLHETQNPDGQFTVRDAIRTFIDPTYRPKPKDEDDLRITPIGNGSTPLAGKGPDESAHGEPVADQQER